jgi:hypothetical protein
VISPSRSTAKGNTTGELVLNRPNGVRLAGKHPKWTG